MAAMVVTTRNAAPPALSSAAEPLRYGMVALPRQAAKPRLNLTLLLEVPRMWKLGRLWTLFRKELLLAWAVLRDPRAPRAAKLATLAAVLYVVSPIDLVSDFIPVLGWLDDGIVAYLLLQVAFKFLPPELMAALRSKVESRARPVAH